MPAPAREVIYAHHSKDRAGAVRLMFRDPVTRAVFTSSPVVAARRLPGTVFDAGERGDLVSAEVDTANSTYALVIPVRLLEHLQAELAVSVG